MDRSSRALLRRIAIGLPFVVAPLGGALLVGFSGCGPCPGPPPPVVTMHAISGAQHTSLIGASGIDPDACAALCRQLRAGDAGSPDAGSAFENGSWQCSVDRVEPDEILTCSFQEFTPGCIGGRRPQGLIAARPRGSDVGAWLARTAHLEAASVPAFEELATELARHGAPRRLSDVARASASDERRHAVVVEALAGCWGARPARVQRAETSHRSLSAIAEDNAIEGCVREAFGALVAAHQASAAQDPVVRAAFASIARDEARHALFSFALHDWARDRLGARASRGLEERRRAELEALRAVAVEPSLGERVLLGLPDATRTVDLVAALAA
jgi:hypothetical protein